MVSVELTFSASSLANIKTRFFQDHRVCYYGLLQLSEIIDVVAKDGTPNLLCNYLFELAGNFMKFYEFYPIIKADEQIKNSRLKLAQLTANTLETGLDLLGIGVMKKM